MQKVIAILILLLVISNNCSVSRRSGPLEAKAPEGSFMEKVISNNLTQQSFNIQKAEINLVNPEVTEKITATVKFKKPDTIMVSIKSFAGIEAARFFMTSDTMLVNDRINRQILYGNPSDFYRRYGFRIEMAGIIFGDFLGDIKDISGDYNCKNGGTIERNVFKERQRIRYTIDCKSRKAQYAEAVSFDSGQIIKFYFRDFKKAGKITYPVNIRIVDEKTSSQIEINIKRIDIDWSGSVKFIPGQGYEKVEIF